MKPKMVLQIQPAISYSQSVKLDEVNFPTIANTIGKRLGHPKVNSTANNKRRRKEQESLTNAPVNEDIHSEKITTAPAQLIDRTTSNHTAALHATPQFKTVNAVSAQNKTPELSNTDVDMEGGSPPVGANVVVATSSPPKHNSTFISFNDDKDHST